MTTSSKSAPCVLWGLGTLSLLPFRSRPASRPSLPQPLPLPSPSSLSVLSRSLGGLYLGLDHLGLRLADRHTLGVDRLRFGLGDHQLVLDSPAALGNPGALADLPAQVVELRAADVAARCHLELLDLRRVERKGPLDADSEGVLADGEGLAGAAALALDHYALEHLGPAAVALNHLEVDTHAVAGAELGALLENALLEALDRCAHGALGAGVIRGCSAGKAEEQPVSCKGRGPRPRRRAEL